VTFADAKVEAEERSHSHCPALCPPPRRPAQFGSGRQAFWRPRRTR
jgi:hypothetical protein